MPGDVNIAAVASLLADPTRISILLALSDGRAMPASDLARQARVAPSTASSHLSKLMEHGLITVEKQGRHRYFRLADPAIVSVLEDLAMFAPATAVRSLQEAAVGEAVRQARTCYNHLAGRLGVLLTQALQEKQILVTLHDGYTLSDDGEHWFSDFGIDDSVLKKGCSLFAPHHIDWSERRYHLAGTLGAAFTNRLFELTWIKRIPSNRAVCVTEEGQEALMKEFGLRW